MKALAVDSATNRLTVSAKNDDKYFSMIFDIGMHQSQTLIPAIDYVLAKVGLTSDELDFTCLCIGPGSFTGLRIAVSALKTIELAKNVPVYAVSSLKTYAEPFFKFSLPILSCVDAKKDKFYASIYEKDVQLWPDGDYEISEIAEKISGYKEIIIAGPDSKLLKEILEKENVCKNVKLITLKAQVDTGESLLNLASEMFSKNEESLKDFEGPVYLRASEAEIKLSKGSL